MIDIRRMQIFNVQKLFLNHALNYLTSSMNNNHCTVFKLTAKKITISFKGQRKKNVYKQT